MNPDNSAFEKLAYNPVNLETVLLSEVVDPDENFFKESLADLVTKYFFPETLPDYFHNNKGFSILHLNIRSLQKHFDNFNSFLSHLNFTFKVICLSETWFHDAKHAASLNLSNYQMINLHRQNGQAGGGACIFIQESIDFKERKDVSISKNDSEILSIEITNQTKNILSSAYIPPDSSLK